MDDNVLKDQLIQQFVNLQRIKVATDRDIEINYQERILKEKMHHLGIRKSCLRDEGKIRGKSK